MRIQSYPTREGASPFGDNNANTYERQMNVHANGATEYGLNVHGNLAYAEIGISEGSVTPALAGNGYNAPVPAKRR